MKLWIKKQYDGVNRTVNERYLVFMINKRHNIAYNNLLQGLTFGTEMVISRKLLELFLGSSKVICHNNC